MFLSLFMGMLSAEPKEEMMHLGQTGPPTVYELILRIAEFNGQDITLLRTQLSPDAQAKPVMHGPGSHKVPRLLVCKDFSGV